jgi:hypothetical protein
MTSNQKSIAQLDKEEIRLELLKNSFTEFQIRYSEQNNKFEFRESVEKIVLQINEYYWEFIAFIKEEKYVRKKGSEEEYPKLNRYKIISATELAIIKFQPIASNPELNAELAIFTVMYFYRSWFKEDLVGIKFNDGRLEKIWSKFLEDRLVWLTVLNTDTQFPFFLNSQIWMLVDLLTRTSD